MALQGARNLGRLIAPFGNVALQIARGERAPITLPTHPMADQGFGYAITLAPTQMLKPSDPVPYTEVNPADFGHPTILGGLFQLVKTAVGAYTSKGTNLIAPTLYKDSGGTAPIAGFAGGSNMGLFDDIWGSIQSAATNIFPTNQGIDWNNVLNQGVSLATTALAPRYSAPSMPMAQPTSLAGAVPRAMIGAGGAVVARGFFNRFPNLATAIQTLRNSGMNVTRSKLYGVMKRFGPEFLVTGGLLTAAAVNELAVAGPGYRRMNPANVRALRRSVRRIESFHRLCTTTDRLRGRKRGRKC